MIGTCGSFSARWRECGAPHVVALVRAGVTFEKGKLVENPTNLKTDTQLA